MARHRIDETEQLGVHGASVGTRKCDVEEPVTVVGEDQRRLGDSRRQCGHGRLVERADLLVAREKGFHAGRCQQAAAILGESDDRYAEVEKRVVPGDGLPVQRGETAVIAHDEIVGEEIAVNDCRGGPAAAHGVAHAPQPVGEPGRELPVGEAGQLCLVPGGEAAGAGGHRQQAGGVHGECVNTGKKSSGGRKAKARQRVAYRPHDPPLQDPGATVQGDGKLAVEARDDFRRRNPQAEHVLHVGGEPGCAWPVMAVKNGEHEIAVHAGQSETGVHRAAGQRYEPRFR